MSRLSDAISHLDVRSLLSRLLSGLSRSEEHAAEDTLVTPGLVRLLRVVEPALPGADPVVYGGRLPGRDRDGHEPLEAAVLWDADKLSKLGTTAVLHFAGYRIAAGEGETEQLKQRICHQPWQEAAVQSFHTEPARAAGIKRLRAFEGFCQQLALEFDGDDLV